VYQNLTQMVLADSCFNLTHESFEKDFDQVLSNAKANNVHYLFSPSSKESEIDTLLKHSETIDNLYIGIGIHPHYASELKPKTFDRLLQYAKHHKVKAIGETGLDYYRNFQSPDVQKKCFEMHLELASEVNLPVFLHHRESFQDFYPILKNYINKIPQSIVHCFTGTEKELESFLELDLYIGITGWVCDLNRGKELRRLVMNIPNNRLLIETDAPYLIPKNLNPKPKMNRNEPMYLKNILLDIADLRMQDANKLAKATTQNFTKLFNC
jgi:TatD DNase family protein